KDVAIPGFRPGAKVPSKVLEARVGKPAILGHAINDAIDDFYRQALEAHKLRPLAQPQADVKSTPDENTFEGNLVFEVEVEVRPEFKLPEYKGLKVVVDEVKVAPIEIDEELDNLRARFGSLKTVERAAKSGDFVSIDLVAAIDGTEIDNAQNISYQIGSGRLLDGIDEALETLTAGETTTFKTKLAGGDKAGADAEVTVTLTAVKERELPKADDAFAQLASEFDTLKELKESLEKQLAESKVYNQSIQARDLALEQIIAAAKVPVSDEVVLADVNRHLEGEGRLEDAEHRKEVTEETTKGFQSQMVLDAIAEAEEVKVAEQELLQYLYVTAQQYQMDPNEFIKIIDQQGQIPAYVAEVARRKGLSLVLEHAEVTDKKGKAVDISAFLGTGLEAGDDHEGHDH
ncbi:MAG: trigger factor, partial [Actinomycetales bacterium]|nr:trigger factor [Actinomycetales bacterium]